MRERNRLMGQSKMFNFLCLLTYLMAKFNGLQSELLISMTEITFCFNSSFQGHRLNATVLEVRYVPSKSVCMEDCFTHPCCRSINYNLATSANNSNECEFLHDQVENKTNLLEENSSFDHIFFIRPLKNYNASCIPKEPKKQINTTDICASFPCQNNGTCAVNETTGYPNCTCPPGYSGLHCETDICNSSSPCLNNGSCAVNRSTGYPNCTCTRGYLGPRCENNTCSSSPCSNNGSCEVNGSTGYRCTCEPGYSGPRCERHICSSYPCQNNGTCLVDEPKDYICSCLQGISGLHCEKTHTSCKEVLENNSSASNGVYYLKLNENSEIYPVYCHMSNLSAKCGGGGWTLVMKLDGDKKLYPVYYEISGRHSFTELLVFLQRFCTGGQTTFEYDSQFWTNKKTLNVTAGLDGLTQNETKLASYHNTPFKKVCLGMTRNNITNWILVKLVNYTATSLYSVIAEDENYSETNVGRKKWMSLINDASLQPNCNKEGFNVKCPRPRSRIGILGNNENNCDSCDSVIGFGIKIWKRKGSSGNIHYIDHKDIDIKLETFGYIFVQ